MGADPPREARTSSRPAGEKHRGGDAVAAPIVRSDWVGNAPVYLGISSMVKASMMSPSLMSLNFSTVRPHS